MKVIIIAVGTELTMGIVQDENAHYLSRRLLEFGLSVGTVLFVRDNEEEIESTVMQYLERADVLLVTGGLGLTSDDITKRVIARVTKRCLTLREDVLDILQQKVSNIKQMGVHDVERLALLPQGSIVLKNPVGFACGFALEIDGCHLIAIPGVPSELKHVYTHSVVPYIEKTVHGPKPFEYRRFRTWGMKELEIQKVVDDVIDSISTGISYSILPTSEGVDICIYVEEGRKNPTKILNLVSGHLKQGLHWNVYAIGEAKMEQVIASILFRKKITLATAESCTGGLLAHRLTNVPDSSSYFLGGFVSYSDDAKCSYLRIGQDMINNFGAVSEVVAVEMAERARVITGANIGLSTTGYAGPSGGTPETPVGTVFVGLSTSTHTRCERVLFTGAREEIKFKATQQALDMLRRHLMVSNGKR